MSHLDYPDASTLDARVRLHFECSTNSYGWQRWVMDHTAPHLYGAILEVGTGPGYLWAEHSARIPPDCQLVLSDRSPGMLKDGRSRLEAAGAPALWLLSDAGTLPFHQDHFDTVIANHMLFLVDEPAVVVAEIVRVLQPSGTLCATTNHRDHLQELRDLLINVSSKHFGYLGLDMSHQRRERFNFVSGAAHLMRHFDDVRLVTYEDGLELDRADILEPWVDYWARPDLELEERKRILAALASYIAREGRIHIRKNSGMFIARNST